MGRICAGNDGAFSFVSGEHEAYRRLGVVHARKILWRAPDLWIVADLLRGGGIHHLEFFLHFDPRVRIEALAEITDAITGLPLRRWAVKFARQTYWLLIHGGGQFDILESTYSDHFGKNETSTVLRWAWHGAIPTESYMPLSPPLFYFPAWQQIGQKNGSKLTVKGSRLAEFRGNSLMGGSPMNILYMSQIIRRKPVLPQCASMTLAGSGSGRARM